MTTPTKRTTADSVQTSKAYAQRIRELETEPLPYDPTAALRAEIPVVKPQVPSEFNRLFSLIKTAIWALFGIPPISSRNIGSLFTHLLIPSLGTREKQEERLDALTNLEGKLSPQEESERQILVRFGQSIRVLDKNLESVYANIRKIQRG